MTLSASLSITLLGPFAVRVDGQPLRLRTDKARALLAYLATAPTVAHRRESLAALLWSEQDERLARTNLRGELSKLRKALAAAGDHIVVTRQTAQFVPSPAVQVDLLQFEIYLRDVREHQHVAVARCLVCLEKLKWAVDLYRGDYLAGLTLPDSELFESWRVQRQEQLHNDAVGALQALIAANQAIGDDQALLQLAEQLLALEAWDEAAHRALIGALARRGDRGAALAQYERCVSLLQNELGIQPSAATVALGDRIRRQQPQSPAAADRRHTPHNLPRETLPFFGRTDELLHLSRLLLDPAYPLVTLMGPGGIGKTRLAQAVGRRFARLAQPLFDDGIWFVPLAALDPAGGDSAANQIVAAIGEQLGLYFQPDSPPRKQLLDFVADKRLLLILDNLEHLQSAAAVDLIADLLAAGDDLNILVTSRLRLNLRSEQVLLLGGLPLPQTTLIDADQALKYDCVRLFVNHARREGSPYSPADHLSDIVSICNRLGGLPLGIELAAALTARQPSAQILAAIDQDLGLLASPYRDMPPRHRTLRVVFDSSWRILAPLDRRALAQLTVFRGGCSDTAARAVVSDAGTTLTTLQNHSLLTRDGDGRLHVHHLVQTFAAEQPIDDAVVERHSAYYLNWLAAQAHRLDSDQAAQTLAELRNEQGNLRRAWRAAVRLQRYDLLDLALPALIHYYSRSGLLGEGAGLLNLAIAAAAPQPLAARLQLALATAHNRTGDFREAQLAAQQVIQSQPQTSLLQARAAYTAGVAAWNLGELDQARRLLDRALAAAERGLAAADGETQLQTLIADSRLALGGVLLRVGANDEAHAQFAAAQSLHNKLGNLYGQAEALKALGQLFKATADWERAIESLQRARQIVERLGDRWGQADLLNAIGVVSYYRGDYPGAHDHYQQAIAIFESVGDKRGASMALGNIGCVNRQLGNYAAGRAMHEKALQVKHAIGFRQGEAWGLVCLSLICQSLEEHDAARAYRRQAAQVYGSMNDQVGQGYALNHQGHDLSADGDWEHAEEAYRQALALRRNVGHLAAESRAGLARVHMACSRLPQALAEVEQILDFMQHGTIDGVEQPFRVLLTCYQVLAAAGDDRAARLLTGAVAELKRRAARLGHPALRNAFLYDISWRRELLQLAA